MRPNHCFIILHVFILAALLLTLKAESEDYDCYPGLNVRRNIVHEALLGEDLTINCTFTFCNNSPSTVSWYKLENTSVPVNFNSSPHIKTVWKDSNSVEGILFLIFQKIQRSDSGQYRCQTVDEVSHTINVSVYGNIEPPIITGKNETKSDLTVTWTTSETWNTTQDTLWLYVYRVPGVVLFVVIVMTIYVASKHGCKGVHCARKPKNTPDPSPQPLPGGSSTNQHVLFTMHIYENYSNGPNATSIC